MQINIYNQFYKSYFETEAFREDFMKSLNMIASVRNIFFVGNGGSNAVCSHMLEDYAKIGRFRTYGFTDPALITCYANDYGYEHAMAEWLKLYFEKDDLLIAISSSGNSKNILNASDFALSQSGKLITLTGFKPTNALRQKGQINFHLPIENYGVVECFHQVILHALLDEYTKSKNS